MTSTPEHGANERPGHIQREHLEMTEEMEISARFAAQMLGGVLSSGPPPKGSMLEWIVNHPNRTGEELRAEYARRGIAFGDADQHDEPAGEDQQTGGED